MNIEPITREHAIELLLAKVEEVLDNNDWPTEEGQSDASRLAAFDKS